MALKKMKRDGALGQQRAPQLDKQETLNVRIVEPIPEELKLGPYKIEGHELLEWDQRSQDYVPVCDAIRLTKILKHLQTGEVDLELEFWAYGKWERKTIKRNELNKKGIQKFNSYGADVLLDSQANSVLAFIRLQEKHLIPENMHSGLGWNWLDGELVYMHRVIRTKGRVIISEYVGGFKIKPAGDYRDYRALIVAEVLGHPELELMLCCGLTALIVGYFNCLGIDDLDTLQIHISGQTTTGKTTAAMLAASVGGSPSNKKEGFVQSYNGTRNALPKIVAGNNGLPIVLDETSMNDMSSEVHSSLVYELAQNREKSRLTKDSELKKGDTWATTIISTGEESVITNVNKNGGLRVRMFEFRDIRWTKDASHAERLKEGLLKNYGHLAPMIADRILDDGPERLAAKLKDNKEYVLEELPKSALSDRIAMKFAVIMTTVQLFEETTQLRMSADDILQLLVDQEMSSLSERDAGPNFYEGLREYMIQHKNKFKLINEKFRPRGEIWGVIEYSSGRTCCYILPKIFERMAKDMKYNNVPVLIKSLKEMGVVEHDPSKNQKKKVIFNKDESSEREHMTGKSGYNSKGDYTYCIVYPGNLFEDFE